jgi:oligopeptidase B
VEVGAGGDVFVLVRDSRQGSTLVETTVDQLPFAGTIVPSYGRLAAAGHEILEVDLYRYWMALYEVSRLDGSQRIRVVDRRTAGEEWIVPLTRREAQEVAHVQSLPGACYEATSLHFCVDTPIAPRAIYEYNFISRRLEKISGGQEEIEEDKYVSMRVAVSSSDGTMVPLSLVHRRQDADTLDQIPVVLMAYGAYGQNLDLSFQPAYQALLNRGYALAFASVRGGGELGVTWHEKGRRHQKSCGIQDYLACAEALHQYLLAKPVRLVAKAFSAGGVVVASAVNQQPQLFDTVVLTNAFLDVYASMNNPDLALTQHEWDEYGNPLEDDLVKEEMRTYCPVHTAPSAYKNPRTLLVGALQDEAVPYWNALVYAQALRHGGSHSNNVSVLIEDGAGHDLAEKLLHVAAVETTFILHEPDK